MAEKEFTIMDLPGVGAATAEKLIDSGYDNLMSIAVATPGELTDLTGITENSARKIIKVARNKLNMGFESGIEVLKKRQLVDKITTGSKNFDGLIGGGVETGCITETFGAYGSSKCIGKDTKILYFNDLDPHLEPIAETYDKYKNIYGEMPYDTGFVVKVPCVEVIGLDKNKLKRTKANMLYKEFAKKIYYIKTKRGREFKITGPHKLLSFEDGLCWKPTGSLRKNDLLAYPSMMDFELNSNLTADDAYFLGVYVAEGSNDRITTGAVLMRDWIVDYVNKKFGYKPTVMVDNRKKKPCYGILIRKNTKEFLGNLSKCKADTKFVPEQVLKGGLNVTSAFLAGYLDGDGCLAKKIASMVTKSKRLSIELAYLFSKLGISTTSRKQYNKKYGEYFGVYVVGEDRELINEIPFKVKSTNYKNLNSRYGYKSKIIQYIKKKYKDTLGGNRGRTKKLIGKSNIKRSLYNYIMDPNYINKSMNSKTMIELFKLLINNLDYLDKALVLSKNLENLKKEEFAELHKLLPFAFNRFKKELVLSGSCFSNYFQRGLPKKNKTTILKIKPLLIKELEERRQETAGFIKTLKNIVFFNWDEIESIKEMNYNDYVYDLVVPEGHCFVGGNMPTLMHNTQLGHILAVTVQLPKEKGGANGMSVFLDGEATFRPERIQQLAKALKLDPEKTLKNIKVARCFNSDHQMLLAEKIEDLIKKDKLPIKLVVVDSLTAHFRAEFIGRGTLSERQQKLNKHMHTLMRLASTYNVAVYVTNQVMAKPDMFFGDPTEAIGGHIVSHNSAFRIYLRKGKKGTRVAKLVDAPNLPDGEAIFMVTEEGLKDT